MLKQVVSEHESFGNVELQMQPKNRSELSVVVEVGPVRESQGDVDMGFSPAQFEHCPALPPKHSCPSLPQPNQCMCEQSECMKAHRYVRGEHENR